MTVRERKYLFLIFMIFFSACVETDIYLPAFPDMMDYFAVSEGSIQGLLTWNFLGICISCPIYGPLSDAIGRKKPLLVALGLFFGGSVLTVAATSFSWMLLGRILQGLGSGGCFSLGTAIIFDTFQRDKAILAVARLNSVVPFLLASAPIVGGYLNYAFGFRANFTAVALSVLVSLMVTLFLFDETLKKEERAPLCRHKLVGDLRRLGVCIPYWQLVLVVSLLLAGFLVFLSSTAVLFVVELGVAKKNFPFFQASVLGAWLAGSISCGPVLRRWGVVFMKWLGSVAVTVGTLAFAFAAWMAPTDPYLLTAPMILYVFGVNWLQGLYFPEAMDLLADIKGITGSVLTSVRLLVAAGVVGTVGMCYDGTVYPLLYAIVGVTVVTVPTIVVYERAKACLR